MSDDKAAIDEHKVLNEGAEAPVSVAEQEQGKAAADYEADAKSNGQLSMNVKVHSPFKEYYNGSAFSISAENATGPFDILPKHHNFISLLMACDLIIRTVAKGDQKIRISGGLMHIKADEVIVFLDV